MALNVARHFPRRNFLIKKGLQLRLAAGAAAAVFISFLLMAWDYYYYFGRNAETGPWDREMIWIFLKANEPLLFQGVFLVVFFTVFTVLYSHRVAGPLYNLEKSMRRLGEGDLAHRVKFRPHDQLIDTKDEFNRMLGSLQDRVARDRDIVLEIRRQLEDLISRNVLDAASRDKLRLLTSRLDQITKGFTL